MAQSDQRTREYLLDLMTRIPREMSDITRQTRDVVTLAQDNAARAAQQVEALQQRLNDVERLIFQLCSVITQAINIEPLWKMLENRLSHSTDGEPQEQADRACARGEPER